MSKCTGRILWSEVFKLLAVLTCFGLLFMTVNVCYGYWKNTTVAPRQLQEAIMLDKCLMTEAKNVLSHDTIITNGILSDMKDICTRDPKHNLYKQKEIFGSFEIKGIKQ